MNLLEFLYRALDAKVGIAIKTSDPVRLRAKLYETRREAAQPAFEELSILISRAHPKSEVWIVRKTSPQKEPENG
jgi:hypothetical protein